jgi:hypothetical protein
MRKISLLASWLALVALLGGQALADDKDEARQLFESGLKLMKGDDFTAAAADFERSSALYPTQNSLFNLANCYKAMQRYAEALDALKRLRQEFGDKLKADIKDAAAQQEADIQSIVATLTIAVEPPSAKVTVDGRESHAGATTGSYLLAPGEHVIEASLAGYRTLRRPMHLVSGAHAAETVVLELEPGYLIVHSDPFGATVLVDGVEKANTPIDEPLALVPGGHVIGLRMTGRKQAERNVEIHPGERQVLEFALAPFEVVAPPAGVVPVAGGSAGTLVMAPDNAKPKTRYWRIAAWSAAAGTLIAGGGVVAFWMVGNRWFDDAKKYDREYAQSGGPNADHNRRAALSNAQLNGYLAIGCGIGAGLLAATAATAFVMDSRRSQEGKSSSLSLTATGLRLGF